MKRCRVLRPLVHHPYGFRRALSEGVPGAAWRGPVRGTAYALAVRPLSLHSDQVYDKMGRLLRPESELMKGAIPMLFLPSQDGQGLTEYALILLFVALAVVLILTLFGEGLGNTYEYISDRLPF